MSGREGSVCVTSKNGGFNVLALATSLCWLFLVSCATVPQIPAGPAPTNEAVTTLIYEWDAIERKEGPAPAVYREQYVRALKTLNDSLAEIARERARQ